MNKNQHFKLLCVEDSARVLRMLKAIFEKAGYDVATAADGIAGLQKVTENPEPFDLIVTDLKMPGRGGLGFIEEARAAGYNGAIVVYAATIARRDRERLWQLDVNRIIPKPARSAELVRAVMEVQKGTLNSRSSGSLLRRVSPKS
ncbi:MAG TPA: response regulator [Chthoniobacterales bacterium]|jgi:CheY-like chemotaxis protein|nr:response regulator [Chthoniobacterales bacterium]